MGAILLKYNFFAAMVILSFVSWGQDQTQADDAIPSVMMLQLPGLSNPDKTGAYASVIRELKFAGLVKSFTVGKHRRAHRDFLSKAASCLAPSSFDFVESYELDLSNFALSYPFNIAKAYLFKAVDPIVLPGEKPILADVGLGLQYGVDKTKYKLLSLSKFEHVLNLVSNNRISAAYVTYPDVMQEEVAQQQIKDFKGEKNLVWSGDEGILCHKEYASTLYKINDSIRQWEKSGKLLKILGKYSTQDLGE